MADTLTTTFEITKPEIGSSHDTWGNKTNANWDKVDDLFDGTIGVTPNLLTGWQVNGVEIDAGGLEINRLSGTTGSLLTTNQTQELAAGFTVSDYDAGTASGTFTPDPADGNFQVVVNDGAFTLAAPASSCSLVLLINGTTNAGTISTFGFTRVTGDPLTAVGFDRFMCTIIRCSNTSVLSVIKLT